MQEGNQGKGLANSQGESKVDYEQCVASDDTHDGEIQYKLHTLLQPCDRKARFTTGLSIRTLQLALDEDPTAASKLIRTGGSDLFPLHLVFQNFESLLKRGLSEEELLSFCMQLVCINPSALLLKDPMLEGKVKFIIPFTIFRPIYSWMNDSYPDEALPNGKYQRHRKYQQQITSSSSEERLHLKLNLLFGSISHGNHIYMLIDECFPRASSHLCHDVEFILKFLSAIIDGDFSRELLQGYEGTDLSVDEVLDMVVLGLVSIPCLLKTLLFCKGCEENIFAFTVVKHLVLESKGSWLLPLTRSYPEKTIIYFRIMSKFLDDDVGGLIDGEYLKPKNDSSQIADGVLLLQANRDMLVESLWSQDEIFSVMTDVPEPLLIELVQTRCAERMVDSDTKKYFTTSLLFFDMVYHTIFPMSFHSAAISLLVHHNVHMFIIYSRLTLACLMYFVARELLHIISTFGSKHRFISCVLSPWNWIDWCTIASAVSEFLLTPFYSFHVRVIKLYAFHFILFEQVFTSRQLTNDLLSIDAESYVVSQGLIDILIIATVFIKLQLLSFIRMSNEELAVFFYSVIQTVKDVRWFMLVLAVVLGSFAQILAFLDIDKDSCLANEGMCEFDASHQLKVVYQMMLGDWDVDNFSTSRGYLIFVIFTFFVGLILLNILIAIASTSYETAKSVGPGIFRVSTNF